MSQQFAGMNGGGSGGGSSSANGYSDQASPNSSQRSSEGTGSGSNHQRPDSATLISRTSKSHTTQHVTTTTKTIREVQYIGPDGRPLDYDPTTTAGSAGGPPPVHPRLGSSTSGNGNYEDYNGYATYEQYGDGSNGNNPMIQGGANAAAASGYVEYPHRAPTPPSPSDRSASPPPQHREPDYLRRSNGSGGPGSLSGYAGAGGGQPQPRSGYDELDTTLMPPRAGDPHHSQHQHYQQQQQQFQPSTGIYGSTNHTNDVVGDLPNLSQQDPLNTSGGGGRRHASVPPPQPPPRPTRASTSSVQHHHYGNHHSLGEQINPAFDLHSLQGSSMGIGGPGGQGYDPQGSVFGEDQEVGDNMNNPYYNNMYQQQQQHYDPIMQQQPQQQPGVSSRPPTRTVENPSRAGMAGVSWRDPDLHEVIEFLSNPNTVIKANAAAYLQHLCFMDDPVKAKTRQLGGIPPLVALLSHDIPEIHRNASGALRNLSYGRQNDENKRAIKAAGGISALVRLLRKTGDNDVKELTAGVLWNLSSCDDLKRNIIDESLLVLVNIVIIPHTGWDPTGSTPGSDTVWSNVLRNASGILRNVSSAGDFGRKKLRECEGLVESMLYLVKKAIEKSNIDNKTVENCVCVLRNLSYRAQEIEDPNYDKKQLPLPGGGESRAGAKPTGDNLGCFGANKAGKGKDAKDANGGPVNGGPPSASTSRGPRTGPVKGMDLLWQPEVVQPYLNLLSNCSNPETLEAAAGAIQNLSACYWQPSIDVRAAVRKEKGLPILVELLRMEVDRVVCAVATALRNLAIDQRNKELIGKYAMRDLVQKLPSGQPQHDHGVSDDTIAAVLATLNEVIKKHPEFSRSLLEAGGVERLITVTRQRQRFTSRVVKFASQVLYSMWVHQELREVYKKAGWKEADFVTKTIAARNARPNSPTNMNSTLNRPMASQSGTRYEDRTIRRSANNTAVASGGNSSSAMAAASAVDGNVMSNSAVQQYNIPGYRPEDVPMENLSLYGRHTGMSPAQAAQQQPAMATYGPAGQMIRPGEPVYAQVDRNKKKNSANHIHPTQQMQQPPHPHNDQLYNQQQLYQDYADHAEHWQQQQQPQQHERIQANPNAQGGDSWV